MSDDPHSGWQIAPGSSDGTAGSDRQHEYDLGIPVTDALTRPAERLVEMVLSGFSELEEKMIASAP